ncbi:NAD(P)H-hydrate dehydratase [Peribacillus deserti]|uniref:Bifunctional NAD(P)H-hydrate repair enzyme n=1 Tax=Peribacillus deserti TaxID=673318 RepID=A0A2N5M5N9_9BACI|nr:NAD(P)H-hydrate dehydratase [Peribacillus deserti]PLT29670.1 bifunctional ADP-dependent NAD(P)H-hydrate dehydratase/NAD(P)H-hydrate epimerase [Peribacillus deserti]
MYIYRADEIKAADEAAENGLTGYTLMESAGRELYQAAAKLINRDQRVLILSGTGNNGGDGIVLARYLKQHGYLCDLVFPIGDPRSEAASEHFRYYKSIGYSVNEIQGKYDVIVDALLGVGARLPLDKKVQELLQWANKEDSLRLAVDVPSGVLSDQGESDESAFKADRTFCIHGYKPSVFMESTAEYYGIPEVLDIGLPHKAKWKVWTKEDVKRTFPKRKPGSHKGSFGNGLIIAGTDEMPGAAILCSLAAKRSGIGKLTVAASRFVSGIIASRLPECVFLHDGLKKIVEGRMPEKMTAAAIGPGLPSDETVELAAAQLLKTNLPLIIDAGALTKRQYPKREAPVILTPHPGEFQKMTGIPVADFQKNRIQTAVDFARENGVILVLKGRNTVIAFPDGEARINTAGNAGLAKGGSGDSLTGILLAFAASYKDIKAAAANAVYFHAACADYWKETRAETTLLASDLNETMPFVMKEFED